MNALETGLSNSVHFFSFVQQHSTKLGCCVKEFAHLLMCSINLSSYCFQLISTSTNFIDCFMYICILNLMAATRFKQLWKGQQETGKIVECTKNRCLDYFTGKG